MSGGDFTQGAIQGAWTAAIADLCNESAADVRRWLAEWGNNGYARLGAATNRIGKPSASRSAKAAATRQAVLKAFRPDPQRAHGLTEWWIEKSGINEFQSSLYTGALTVGAAELCIWGWVVGPEAYYSALLWTGTPQGQQVLQGVVDGLAPGPPSNAYGVGVSIMKDTILTFTK
jgi:hypothetical protein